mmetsp:Transcript_86208/g.243492  ORF Transcript_86208/g.243492 Transcript_86208/m.243492 type:complete len:323 (-) Transcript_86208:41-1009(-)
MFIKKDTRKVVEILAEDGADPSKPLTELHLGRRHAEFKGKVSVLCQRAHKAALANVERLSLYDDQLTSIRGISLFAVHSNLTELNLGRNQLTELPDEFGKLQSLRRLWLDDNKLSTFPECVLNLEGLEVLRLQNNDLKSIPPQIRVLRSLRELAADNNELVEVPDTLTELTCLAKLMLRQNSLTALPSELGQLSSLEMLAVSSNQLTSLPASIADCAALELVYVNSNQLTEVPVMLMALPNLKEANLSNNAITVAAWGECEFDLKSGLFDTAGGAKITMLGCKLRPLGGEAEEDAPTSATKGLVAPELDASTAATAMEIVDF